MHELTALREARFTPTTISSFLRASYDRAALSRAERPGLAAQSRRWIVIGTLATLALREIAARQCKPVPQRNTMLAWLTLQALMLDWHLGMLETPSGERRDALSAADALTLTRAAIAPLAAAAPPDRGWFILLLGLGGMTDLLDGRVARRSGPTRFGRDFDSLADLAFRFAAIRGAGREHWIDQAAYRALTARQALFAGRALWYWFARSQRPPPDSQPLDRWHVPMLLVGLGSGALGHNRTGSRLVTVSAIVGSIGLAGLSPRHGSTSQAGHASRERPSTARSPIS